MNASILVDEPDFKVPCRDINGRARHLSTKSSLADDEESLADSVDYDSDVQATSSIVNETVNVYLRLKPTLFAIPDVYNINEDKSTVMLKDSHSNQSSSTERQYLFTSIFNQLTTQSTVFENCVRPILQEPFAGQGAVFASYGVSNSGKTYTILGEKDAGLVPRALTQIFTEFENQIDLPCVKIVNDQVTVLNDQQVLDEMETTNDFIKESRKSYKSKLIYDTWKGSTIKNEHQFEPKDNLLMTKVYIWISFLEIYNDKIIDLFQPHNSRAPSTSKFERNLKIISNNGNPYVHGLTWLSVSKVEDALELLQHGLRSVNYAATNLNPHSSRSHTIFTINLISESPKDFEFSSFKFCDLAGAERSDKTGNGGARLKETGGINTSLLTLGRCLEAVQHNQKTGVKKKNVPVRESKLTSLLQGSLLGHENFVMIVNLLPTIEYFAENINVLHFGSIANKIVTRKTEVRRFSRYTYFMRPASSAFMNSSVLLEESM